MDIYLDDDGIDIRQSSTQEGGSNGEGEFHSEYSRLRANSHSFKTMKERNNRANVSSEQDGMSKSDWQTAGPIKVHPTGEQPI